VKELLADHLEEMQDKPKEPSRIACAEEFYEDYLEDEKDKQVYKEVFLTWAFNENRAGVDFFWFEFDKYKAALEWYCEPFELKKKKKETFSKAGWDAVFEKHFKQMATKKSEKARIACTNEFHDERLVYVDERMLYDRIRKTIDFGKDFSYEEYEKKIREYQPTDETDDSTFTNLLAQKFSEVKLGPNDHLLNDPGKQSTTPSQTPTQRKAEHREKHPNCPCFSHARPNCSDGGKCAGMTVCINMCKDCLVKCTGSDENCFGCHVKLSFSEKSESNRAKACSTHSTMWGGGAGKDKQQGECIRCHKGGTIKKVHFCTACKDNCECGQMCVYTLCEK